MSFEFIFSLFARAFQGLEHMSFKEGYAYFLRLQLVREI